MSCGEICVLIVCDEMSTGCCAMRTADRRRGRGCCLKRGGGQVGAGTVTGTTYRCGGRVPHGMAGIVSGIRDMAQSQSL